MSTLLLVDEKALTQKHNFTKNTRKRLKATENVWNVKQSLLKKQYKQQKECIWTAADKIFALQQKKISW